MLKSPPMFPTPMTPEDIIGRANVDLFEKFYKIAVCETNNGEYPDKRLNKEIGASDRKAIAETLRHLREHGFYPNGLNKHSRVCWGVMVKSESQIEVEKGLAELEKLPTKKLQQMAREGYLKVVESVAVNKPTEGDIQHAKATER